MNGIGKDFPFDALKDVTLDYIGFGANVVNLSFSNDASLSIMGKFRLNTTPPSHSITLVESKPNGLSILYAQALVSLIFHKVVLASTENYKDLILRFDTNTLIIFDDMPNYESYILSYKGRDYVI